MTTPAVDVTPQYQDTSSGQYIMSRSTVAMHAMSFFIRLYRMWRVLVKHDDKMWRAMRVCARQVKFVRKKFNYYDTTKHTLIVVTLALASFGVIVSVLLTNNRVARRRVAVIYSPITTHTMLWRPMYAPYVNQMLGDQVYHMSYTKGFSDSPSPAQVKASLAEQLSVDQQKIEFRRSVQTNIAQELIDFYLESLDRDEMIGFFERLGVLLIFYEDH